MRELDEMVTVHDIDGELSIAPTDPLPSIAPDPNWEGRPETLGHCWGLSSTLREAVEEARSLRPAQFYLQRRGQGRDPSLHRQRPPTAYQSQQWQAQSYPHSSQRAE